MFNVRLDRLMDKNVMVYYIDETQMYFIVRGRYNGGYYTDQINYFNSFGECCIRDSMF